MKRDIYQKLFEWKTSLRRKPLLLQGARQTGKTYILKEFGNKEYSQVHYFNFEQDSRLSHFFDKSMKPSRIIDDLSVYSGKAIAPGKDLIIFDEIQVSNNALNSLKYFQEEANEYHVAAAGSLLGVKMSSPGSFPVGKVNFLKIHPLSFYEFLDALSEGRYREMLENKKDLSPLSVPYHERLIECLRSYYFVGGMPEAVKHYVLSKDMKVVRDVQEEILISYVYDFAKHAPASDIPKLNLIWESLVKYLSKENKKFMFSALKNGARAREYENAIVWLENAGLVHRAYSVDKSCFPLSQYADRGCFKIYCLDIGLLGALAKTPVNISSFQEGLFTEYAGAFVENYTAQQLIGAGKESLYYWSNKGGQAEVDFIIEGKDAVFPLEVKAGVNVKSKSLMVYNEKFNPPLLTRTSLLNFSQDGRSVNIPLYSVSAFVKNKG